MVHGSWLFIHGHFWARLLQLPPSGDCLLRPPPPFPVGVAAPGEEE